MAVVKTIAEIDEQTQMPKDWLPLFVWFEYMYKQQKDFLRSDAWQVFMIAGNGTGKTFVVYYYVVMQALGIHPKQLAKPPIKIQAIVPDFDKVQDIALEKLLEAQIIQPSGVEVGPLLPHSMIKKGFSREHRSIELNNGSVIGWMTDEQGWQAHRGKQFDLLVIDEECSERVYDENIRGLRNAKGGGKVIAGLTPPYEAGKGPTWTKERILDKSVNNPNIDVINACMADNPAITQEFIKVFSEGKTQEMIDVQIYGKYPSWGDLVHKGFQDFLWDSAKCEGNLLPNDHPMPENWDVDWVMAFDWHPSKACAAVFGFIDQDGNPVFFDELDKDVAKDKEIDELAAIFRAIEGFPHEKRRFKRWQDPSAKSKYQAVQRGFNAWDAFRKAGIITSAGKNRDPNVGIDIVNEYIRGNKKDHPRMLVYERCKHLRHYLNNHYWKRAGDGIAKPDPKWSDYPITVRYILGEIGISRRNRGRNRVDWPLQSFKKPQDKRQITDLSRYV